MRILCSLAILAFAASTTFAQPAAPTSTVPAAHDLVELVIQKPGGFQQACSLFSSEPNPSFLAYNVYNRSKEEFVTPENFLKLRQQRAAVIADLIARLDSYDGPSTSTPAFSLSNQLYPVDTLLLILLDLNAVEALPALLRAEQFLQPLPPVGVNERTIQDLSPADLLKFAQGDRTVYTPHAPQKIPPYENLNPREQQYLQQWETSKGFVASAKESQIHFIALNHLYAQRNLLGVIAAILRQQQYAPLLQSDLEKQFQAGLSAIAPKDVKTPADVTPNEKQYIVFDPVSHLPYYGDRGVEVPYTDALRAQIIAWANDYLKSTPAAQLDGTAGMNPQPILR